MKSFINSLTISLLTTLAILSGNSSALAQMPTVGTNGAPPANSQTVDMSQLPPEVRNLIPQNQGGTQPMPTPNVIQNPSVVPFKPPGAAPGTYSMPQEQEAFPTSQSPNTRPNGTVERFTPSEVISVLPPIARTADIRAVLRTSVGDITIKLDRARAPQTVAHFIALAKGEKEFVDVKTSKRAKRPFYNGLIFHRVVRGYLIQTGCPFGTGRGGPGDIATIKDEIVPGAMSFNRPGLVAMAPIRDATGLRTTKDTNGSQFFITMKEMPTWDDQYTIFGEVEDGMDVVEKISNVKVGPTERPIKRIYLVAVDIIEGATVK